MVWLPCHLIVNIASCLEICFLFCPSELNTEERNEGKRKLDREKKICDKSLGQGMSHGKCKALVAGLGNCSHIYPSHVNVMCTRFFATLCDANQTYYIAALHRLLENIRLRIINHWQKQTTCNKPSLVLCISLILGISLRSCFR